MAKNVEQLLYVIEKTEKKTVSHNMHAQNVGLKAGNYVIRREGADIVIEVNTTANGKAAKYKKGRYLQEQQEDGTIILKPANGTTFELVEKDGKIPLVTLNVTVKNFIAEYGARGIWGLFATGERMSVVKMR
ncbi:MAG: hypothetical protein ACETWE_09140 [Candidatus Bathyarchaeia archaeon]